ncbi:uncharacterized protein LOC111712831 isoform X2 [Eurytemora carolleeae]|uniref:uncharacterized protein LOC111712831 isoform X2 n=1 Tax=Eurytemora carolleeae TaxID=1294199 RepID=UPI000C77FFAB|nr:uncharacterized protein LOC111712831 isoform X2 [Eurytemora carolleeae]|eukprot:XP_023343337.1 uncharacterized protein LOC111712831 isoform X2 [Eurytemora affinis]
MLVLSVVLLVLPLLVDGQVSQFSAYQEKEEVQNPRAARATLSNALPQDLVSDIHCMDTPSKQEFSSQLRLPPGHTAPPVLEGVSRPSAQCSILETGVGGVYSVELGGLEGCGVRECIEQGETWLCLLIRLPLLQGLMLPEDEIIDIKCRPQDRSVAGNNAINFQENLVEQKSPIIFSGGGQEFLSEIGLFRKLAGTELFAARVKSGSSIELGENVQLRSIVRSGDGWNYSRLTDIVVHRVQGGKTLSGPGNSVKLVHSDGCRDPNYKALAPYPPWRDESNHLINNFDFRVFMFQDMAEDDAIMITAQVVACVEEADCQVFCGDRVRRSEDSASSRTRRSTIGKTEGWEENLEIKVTLPDSVSKDDSNPVVECRLYLILTLATALTFCLLSAAIVLVACYKRWRETKSNNKEVSDCDTSSESMTSKASSETGPESQLPAYYLVPYAARTPQPRPVTVRSVKRRDRGKSLERRGVAGEGEGGFRSQPAHQTTLGQDDRAVMV